MTARKWPVEHARAWLLRKAAEFAEHKQAGVSRIAEWAIDDDTLGPVFSEKTFRRFLATVSGADVDRGVAEVYVAAKKTVEGDGILDSPVPTPTRSTPARRGVVLKPAPLVIEDDCAAPDPIGELLAKLEAEANSYPEGTVFHHTDDPEPVLMVDVYRFAEKTIRRLTGREQ